jgi:hypothetical protein
MKNKANRIKRVLTFGIIFLLLFLSFAANPEVKAQSEPDYFTIAVIPDTQNYSESFPAIFDQQAQWIVDNAESENIVFAAHLGDLVDNYTSGYEWQNAVHSMEIIRNAGIPYSVVPGNHDLDGPAGPTTTFDSWFPYTDFTGYSWYGGHYPSDSNASNYELFSAQGQDYLILNVVCSPSMIDDAIPWANSILTQYSTRRAIVITHGYIDTSGNYITSGNVSGVAIWNNIVQFHSNIIAVFCGHYNGEFYNTATGLNGNRIYNLLTDYQYSDHGGNGWLRLYKFYPQLNKISAVTYSPYLDQYDISQYGQFDITVALSGPIQTMPFWDLNHDYVCDIGDVVKLGLEWNQTGAEGWIPEDLNNDGIIDIGDVVMLGLHWNELW